MNDMVDVNQDSTALIAQQKHEALIDYEASKSVPFITAAWASIGVAIMASVAGSPSGIADVVSDNVLVVVPFVGGVYLASYLAGRWLARKRVRENVFLSMGVSFLVAEGVLFSGSVLGAIGAAIRELMTASSHGDLGELLVIPFMIAAFGAMFCVPLAVGLGAHVRLWSLWKTQTLQRETLIHEQASSALASVPGRWEEDVMHG